MRHPRRIGKLALYRDEGNAVRAAKARRGLDSPPWRAFAHPERREGLSVVILNLDRPELLVPLVEQLRGHADAFAGRGLFFEICVGDTGSTDPAVLALYESPDLVVVRGLRYHFSENNNQVAFERTRGSQILFLNNDVLFDADGPGPLALFDFLCAHPAFGVAGTTLFFPDGTLQHDGIGFLEREEVRGLPYHPRARENLDPATLPGHRESPAVTGACLQIRAGLFQALGGMDESYAKECQDVALCLAAGRLGQRTALVATGRTIHRENATRPRGEEHWGDRRLFLRRWGSYIA